LRLVPEALDLDWREVEKRIIRFIKSYVEKSEAEGTVIGLSGGVDSSTVAVLAAKAIGRQKILGIMLPEREMHNTDDMKYARLVAEKFGLKTETIDITNTLQVFYNSTPIFDPTDRVSKGNIKARTRMIYIYYYANRLGMLVCGSSDKSETMMGYFTKWGDVAADISPIMDLYKTQVRKLAEHLGLPEEVVAKPSSPALWPGQLAEEELGVKYEQLDLILYGLEHFMRSEEIAAELHMEKQLVNEIRRRWLLSEHKRRMLLTAKLEYRTVATDFRLPRSP